MGQKNRCDSLANALRSALVQSRLPNAPSAGVGKNAIKASKIKRIPHAGCHNSGWNAENDKQILVLISNRPDLVKNMMCGGLNGYSGGNKIRP